MLKKLLPSLLLFSALITQAQTWKGKVVNQQGEALPFVNVFFEGTSSGTTTNMSGEFSLVQPATVSSKALIFQFVGFEKVRLDLANQNADQNIRVTLKEQMLKEVVIASYKKDPAYYIIKQAQKKRKYYLNQVESYSCKIYMKGTTRLVEKPDKLPAFIKLAAGKEAQKEIDSTKLGLLYLQESLTNVYYSKKDGFKEEMIASKVSGSAESFSWNRAQEVLENFYEERLRMAGLNERGFVSPIAGDAMLFYDYKLLGTFKEDGLTVNRIQVMPKRKSDLSFNGTIYIIEDLWNIHSLNMKVSKDAQIEFLDSISINQSYSRLTKDVFMPLSLQMTYHFGLFGFRASYDAVGNITDYEIGKASPLKFAKNQVFAVSDTANKQDSTFWNTNRPVVLSGEEETNITKGDSIKEVRQSKEYLDSIDAKRNKFRAFDVVSGGYSYSNRYDSLYYNVNSVISGLQYNAVDGAALELTPTRSKTTPLGFVNDEFGLRYGFSSNRPGARFRHSVLHNRKNYFRHSYELGYFTYQINEAQPITPFINTLYTLIDGKNYAQYYQKAFVKASVSGEVRNGIVLGAGVEYALRQNLYNAETYNFGHRPLANLENLGAGTSTGGSAFGANTIGSAIKFNLIANFTFKNKFAIYPNRKSNYGSKYPKLRLHYQLGLVPASNAAQKNIWHEVEAEVSDEVRMGLIGSGEYSVKAGSFFGEGPKNFVDYKHFIGNQTVFFNNAQNAFQNLPYYGYSTNKRYLEAHYEHHFYGFLLNKIPLVKKLKWKETGGVNFLYAEGGKNYTEIYAGIDNIFRFFKVHFVSYYQTGMPLRPALRIGFRVG